MGDKPGRVTRVIVTRPLQEATQWADELTRYGSTSGGQGDFPTPFRTEVLPLIDIGPVTDQASTAQLHHAWQNLSDYAACMFVSGNAVQHFFQQKMASAQAKHGPDAIHMIVNEEPRPWSASLRFLAPGPGTAAALRAAGVPAAQIDSPPLDAGQFDSQALWQVIGQRDWRGKRVLVLCGTMGPGVGESVGTSVSQTPVGRDWLAQKFAAVGAQVDRLVVYQRTSPRLEDAQLERVRTASHDGSVWLFSSSEAVANLIQQPALQSAPYVPGVNWQHARAVATHPRIAQAVRAAGWGVVQASRPTLADVAAALRSIESNPHE